MRRELDRLKRIARLQRRLSDLAIWRRATLERERADLNRAHGEMLAALSEGLLALGGAAAAGSRRIRGLEVDIAAAEDVGAAQARETLARETRSRLAGRAVEAARARHRGESERKGLAELIEWTLQAAGSASRKP